MALSDGHIGVQAAGLNSVVIGPDEDTGSAVVVMASAVVGCKDVAAVVVGPAVEEADSVVGAVIAPVVRCKVVAVVVASTSVVSVTA